MTQEARTPAFEGGTAFLLARVGAAARRDWARMLTERDLTPHQHGVLMALAEFGPTGQQQLSDAIGVDPRNAVPVVEALVERALLVRDVDPADRRRRVLTLTASGQDLVHEMRTTGGGPGAGSPAGTGPCRSAAPPPDAGRPAGRTRTMIVRSGTEATAVSCSHHSQRS